jgi:hypothetical protein
MHAHENGLAFWALEKSWTFMDYVMTFNVQKLQIMNEYMLVNINRSFWSNLNM